MIKAIARLRAPERWPPALHPARNRIQTASESSCHARRFAGTPEFAARALRVLLHAGPDHGLQVVAAYTQPDRPAGRGMKLTASAVKEVALAHHLPVLQPATLRAGGLRRSWQRCSRT